MTSGPTTWRRSALLREGQTYVDLPERLRRYRSDVFTDKYKRLSWDELCRSITAHIAKDGYWYIHPDQHRTLSIREAARVQTFPDRSASPAPRRTATGRSATRFRSFSARRSAARCCRHSSVHGACRADGAEQHLRDVLIDWHADRRARGARRGGPAGDPWQVLIGELALARARPRDAERHPRSAARGSRRRPRLLVARRRRSSGSSAIGLKERRDERRGRRRRARRPTSTATSQPTSSTCACFPASATTSAEPVLTFGFGRRQVLRRPHDGPRRARVHGTSTTGGASSCGSTCTGSPGRRARRRLQRGAAGSRTLVCTTGTPHCGSARCGAMCATGRRAGAPGDAGRDAGRARDRRRPHERRFVTVLPSAGRLMHSLRDIGYELPSAIADLVDNSIDANARRIDITFHADGADSWVRVADDGIGMTLGAARRGDALRQRRGLRRRGARPLRPRTQDRVAVAVPPAHGRLAFGGGRPRRHPPLGSRRGRTAQLLGSRARRAACAHRDQLLDALPATAGPSCSGRGSTACSPVGPRPGLTARVLRTAVEEVAST